MTDNIESMPLDRSKGKQQPLYQQISSNIRGLIESEKLDDGYNLPSIATISKMLNISYRTAKMAYDILESDNYVKYIPNKGAVVTQKRRIEDNKTLAITFVRPRINSVWGAISRGIEKYCLEHDIAFSLCDANSSHDSYLDALKYPVADNQGLLVTPYELDEYREILNMLINDGVKIVFVDRTLSGVNASSVSADHFLGVFEIVSHLLDVHGLPVYYFGQYKSPSSSRSWFEGWKSAMCDYGFYDTNNYIHGLGVEEAELFTHKWFAVEDITEEALRFLQSVKKFPCSVFASGDHIAKGIYIAAEEIGLKIGEDIFLAGYGNIPMCERVSVPLSSVDQNSEQVGYSSAELLHRHLRRELRSVVHLACPTRLCIRQSSEGV